MSGAPAIVFQHEFHRELIMADSDQGLHVVFFHLSDDILIELQTFFVRGVFISGRIDPAPADRETEYIEAHAGH